MATRHTPSPIEKISTKPERVFLIRRKTLNDLPELARRTAEKLVQAGQLVIIEGGG